MAFEWREKETQEPAVAERLEKALKQSHRMEIRRTESEELAWQVDLDVSRVFFRDFQVKWVKSDEIPMSLGLRRSCFQSLLGSTPCNYCVWPRTP